MKTRVCLGFSFVAILFGSRVTQIKINWIKNVQRKWRNEMRMSNNLLRFCKMQMTIYGSSQMKQFKYFGKLNWIEFECVTFFPHIVCTVFGVAAFILLTIVDKITLVRTTKCTFIIFPSFLSSLAKEFDLSSAKKPLPETVFIVTFQDTVHIAWDRHFSLANKMFVTFSMTISRKVN